MIQETRNSPRSQDAPGKFVQKNRASPKPKRNWPAIEAPTKMAVLVKIGQVSRWENSET